MWVMHLWKYSECCHCLDLWQVKECTSALLRFAKKTKIPVLLVSINCLKCIHLFLYFLLMSVKFLIWSLEKWSGKNIKFFYTYQFLPIALLFISYYMEMLPPMICMSNECEVLDHCFSSCLFKVFTFILFCSLEFVGSLSLCILDNSIKYCFFCPTEALMVVTLYYKPLCYEFPHFC